MAECIKAGVEIDERFALLLGEFRDAFAREERKRWRGARVRMPADLLAKLDRLAAEEGVTRDELITMAVGWLFVARDRSRRTLGEVVLGRSA